MAAANGIAPELQSFLRFLRENPHVRSRIPAPRNKTVVYCGEMLNAGQVHAAWRLLKQAKAQDPVRFDYVTVEERLQSLFVVEFGRTLYEEAGQLSDALNAKGLADQSMILWRALSGIYVQGAHGRVRALILPGANIAKKVFSVTEVKVLLRPDVLANIDLDAELLRAFRLYVQGGLTPAPIVVF